MILTISLILLVCILVTHYRSQGPLSYDYFPYSTVRAADNVNATLEFLDDIAVGVIDSLCCIGGILHIIYTSACHYREASHLIGGTLVVLVAGLAGRYFHITGLFAVEIVLAVYN